MDPEGLPAIRMMEGRWGVVWRGAGRGCWGTAPLHSPCTRTRAHLRTRVRVTNIAAQTHTPLISQQTQTRLSILRNLVIFLDSN